VIEAATSDDDINACVSPSAPRTILVDGFNVLHAVLLGHDRGSGWWRREHRERLLERLCQWQEGPDQIWVAFDGTRPAESIWAEPIAIVRPGHAKGEKKAPTIHSVFVESADDWIVRRARKSGEPARMIVVSADRKVAGRARSAGCEIMTPWDFMGRCGSECGSDGGSDCRSADGGSECGPGGASDIGADCE
jgi:predicted RNA-binding protein with PIN domain